MLPVKLDDLIHARTVESVRIDFKATWNPVIADAVVSTVCAFANDFQGLNGGYVVLGIEEDGGVPRLPPRGLDDLDLEKVQKEIHKRCAGMITPAYVPLVVPGLYQDRSIVVIYAPAGDARPYQAPGTRGGERGHWVRIGPETRRAEGPLLNQLLELSVRLPFDERRRQGVSLAVISPRILARYLAESGSDLAVDPSQLDVPDVLRRLRLSSGTNGSEAPKNAALLCFTEDPEAYLESRGIRIELAQFRDDQGGDLIETHAFTGPLQSQIRDTLGFLDRLFGEIVRKLPDEAQSERFVAFPQSALREAIVNAVYHRSYEGAHQPPRIGLYPDRIEITSYPGPIAGLEARHLDPGAKPPQVPPRNPLVGDLLKAIRLAETWHTGVPKIHRVMRENGSPSPTFEFDEARTYFRVILPAHPGYVVLHALREAAVLWHTGEHTRAVEFLVHARSRVPGSGALAAMTITYIAEIGDLQAARKVLRELEQTPGAYERHLAYAALARAYIDSGDTDAAATLLANTPRATSPRELLDQAILYRRTRRLEDAHRTFVEIADTIRSDPKALHEWAQTKLDLARPPVPSDAQMLLRRDAVALLERVLQLAADQRQRSAHAWFDVARARDGLGDPPARVQEALDQAITLDPEASRFHTLKPRRPAGP